jgi:dynein heavy chain
MAQEMRYFVDFMRDAPEPTGEEVEDADMELPKIYEPIESFKPLEERLKTFLDQFNEILRGSNMDLVFFPDAIINLIKISRIIRNPGGNMMLVGVGGSGKQSLTKLASFIAGYKTFQVGFFLAKILYNAIYLQQNLLLLMSERSTKSIFSCKWQL